MTLLTVKMPNESMESNWFPNGFPVKELLKENRRKTWKKCEICSKSTIETPEQYQWRRSGIFIVNFKHISHLFLEFLLSTLNRKMFARLFDVKNFVRYFPWRYFLPIRSIEYHKKYNTKSLNGNRSLRHPKIEFQ